MIDIKANLLTTGIPLFRHGGYVNSTEGQHNYG